MPKGVYIRTTEHKEKMKNSVTHHRFPLGHVPWNKGLSPTTNEKVRERVCGLLKYCQSPEGRAKSRETAKRLWFNMSKEEREAFSLKGRHESWNKGLSAKTSERVRKCVEGQVLAHKTNPNWAEKSRKIMAELHKNNPEYHQRVMSLLYKGRDELWADPQKKAEKVQNWARGNMKRPTLLEQKVVNAINEFNLPYKYTGGGDFILAGKIPDFVNINGEKKIIEVFGDYWHDRESSEAEDRIELFAQFGFQTLILWGKELNAMNYEQIATRIGVFK